MLSMWRLTWVWLGCAAVITFAGCQWSGLNIIVDRSLTCLSFVWCVVLTGALWSARHPSFKVVSAPLQALAQLIAVSIICALLQYVAVRTGRPLIDEDLAKFDHALYFDWSGSFDWVLRHPTVLKVLSSVYLSLGLQSVLVCIVAWRYPDRASQTLAANALTLTICLLVFVEWPAGGAFAYYHPHGIASDYVQQFMAARAGMVTYLDFGQMQGIIQFPSYHAAAAILLAYAFAALPVWIAIPAAVIEITSVVSAVPMGGHHLVDVLAGIAVATLSLVITVGFAKFGFRYWVRTGPKAAGLIRA